jgi:outer membrane protein assembly factor BamB
MLPARTTVLFLLALTAPGILFAWAPAPLRPSSRDVRGWPGWRGPLRTGVSADTDLLARWGKEGPRLLWKTTTLGIGFSTPAISRGRIYVLGTRANKEQVIVLDATQMGKELWVAELGPLDSSESPPRHAGPRSTPTVDGDRLYTLGSQGDLLCLSTDGKQVWRKHLVRDLEGQRSSWGYAESPLVDRDLLICTPGGPKATMAALDKKTGAVVWKACVVKGNHAAYASPIVAEVGQVRQYIQFLSGCLVGVGAKDGKVLWSYDGIIGSFNCATPIFHDGHVFVTASDSSRPVKNGGALLALKITNGNVTAKEIYRTTALANYLGGVVLVNGALYGTCDSALVCVDFKTGKTNWQNNSVGQASIIGADGHLYVNGDHGAVALVAAMPAGYLEKSRFSAPHRSKSSVRAHPAIADGKLYLRDQETLSCYDLRKE